MKTPLFLVGVAKMFFQFLAFRLMKCDQKIQRMFKLKEKLLQ